MPPRIIHQISSFLKYLNHLVFLATCVQRRKEQNICVSLKNTATKVHIKVLPTSQNNHRPKTIKKASKI